MSRRPTGRFLAPGAAGNDHGYRTRPPLDLPPAVHEPNPHREFAVLAELLDYAQRVAEARSIDHEPECIGPAIFNPDPRGEDASLRLWKHRALRVAEARQARTLTSTEDRLRDAQRRAKRQHVDVSHEVHVLTAMLDRARRGGRREPPSMIARLVRLEALLDHATDLPEAA
jgi:hypothetical protein